MLKSKFPFYLILLAVLFSCAKRGHITGGEKDTTPPVITSSSPKNFSTGFTGNFIKINFNEYIKVKDINKQLIISPPMKNAPEIVPMGSASKFITIKLKDTLEPNTTYSFNFGQSISDNNEGNPYSQFKYVFSTGTSIDSLKLGGTIKDAKSKKTDNFVSVMLYEASKFNDSTVYKKQPHYVTNTLDSLKTFTLENLKAGSYYLVALKDENKNYRFDPKTDKIAFFKNPINVPNDTSYNLGLFKEQLPFKAEKPKQVSANQLLMGHEGKPKNIVVSIKDKGVDLPVVVTKFEKKDSLQLWVPKIKTDSLQISISSNQYSKSFSVKTKEMKVIDTLSFKTKQTGLLDFRDSFTVLPSTPLVKIDNSKIRIIKKDSTEVAFTSKYKEWENELVFDFKKEEDQKYSITLLPGALKDFYEKQNDTLSYTVSTRKLTDYGNLKIVLENVNRFPILVELLDKDENVIISQYSEKETEFNFETVEPQKYILRVIYDDNKDGEWTTGSYLEKRLPEEVIYHPKEIDLRANWDWEERFILSK
ncbi:Ig-like domain-containing protein [Flavobacterium sp. SM15]|uniref:Ig-like domain-containing protein n=1 Tax=Flavobacterium sp. SM15 TaxID=2908005 RepID=UPI001EDB4339|nr:Ig-like domain-containing protein [Flavobacterium sp. SM15]MCG2610215.1 Ig-like domain-containing protein [Flavobacterium sp. SM15]